MELSQRPEGINSVSRSGLFGLDVLRLTPVTQSMVVLGQSRHTPFDQHLPVHKSIPQVWLLNHDWMELTRLME